MPIKTPNQLRSLHFFHCQATAFCVSKKIKHYLATKHLLHYLYCHQNTFAQLGSSTKPSFEKVERIPREMNQKSLAQLVIHPHGFSTGTKDRPGRLILRDVLGHEIAQFKRILTTPENLNYPGADPGLANIPDSVLQTHVSKEHGKTKHTVNLFIILKPGLEDSMNMPFERVPHMVNGGHVIGFMTLTLDQHPHDPSDCGAYIGIIIHHEARGQYFSKEAFIAVLDYILLGQPTTLRNGNLGGLGLRKAFIETAVENKALRGLMESIYLKRLEREATPDHGQRGRMIVPNVTYTVTKPEWLEARKQITMDWMPEGQQALSRDGSPNLGELERGHASGSGHGAGIGDASGSGHGAGIGHLSGNGRFGYGAYK
jgi:RimJ/RimL family protein N-acetyltransferase